MTEFKEFAEGVGYEPKPVILLVRGDAIMFFTQDKKFIDCIDLDPDVPEEASWEYKQIRIAESVHDMHRRLNRPLRDIELVAKGEANEQ